jgi:hypothetical protein
MIRRMEFKTIAYDTKEGFENEDRIYQLGYLLYELDSNRGKFSDGIHHFKDLPYFCGNESSEPSKDGWDKETLYQLGDMVRDNNDNFFISVSNNNIDNPLIDKLYWRQITNEDTSGDSKVTIKNSKVDVEAKICLTTINSHDCPCDDDCNCNCNSKKDVLKISKENSPTVNLKTGVLKVPGGIEVNGDSFEELVERVRILEEKIAELENREEGF